jgi:hypothetical protein
MSEATTELPGEFVKVDDLEGFDNTAVGMAEMFWKGEEPNGDPMPHVVIEDWFGQLHVMAIDGAFMQDSEHKGQLIRMVQQHIARYYGRRVAFLCGAWTAHHDKDVNPMDVAAPSEDPNRIEISFVQILEPKGVERFYSTKVIRSDEEPELEGWTLMDGTTDGRFLAAWSPLLDTTADMYAKGVDTFGDGEEGKEAMLKASKEVMDLIYGGHEKGLKFLGGTGDAEQPCGHSIDSVKIAGFGTYCKECFPNGAPDEETYAIENARMAQTMEGGCGKMYVAAASIDGKVAVIPLETEDEAMRAAHECPVKCWVIDPDGKHIATIEADEDGVSATLKARD